MTTPAAVLARAVSVVAEDVGEYLSSYRQAFQAYLRRSRRASPYQLLPGSLPVPLYFSPIRSRTSLTRPTPSRTSLTRRGLRFTGGSISLCWCVNANRNCGCANLHFTCARPISLLQTRLSMRGMASAFLRHARVPLEKSLTAGWAIPAAEVQS